MDATDLAIGVKVRSLIDYARYNVRQGDTGCIVRIEDKGAARGAYIVCRWDKHGGDDQGWWISSPKPEEWLHDIAHLEAIKDCEDTRAYLEAVSSFSRKENV